MTTEGPSLWQRLAEQYPLPTPEARAEVAEGPVAAAAAYAKHASRAGTKGEWWRVWRAIESARGHGLREAIDTLTPEGRRWFARWSLERGEHVEGAMAYRAYLAEPGGVGPFDPENALYLEAVARSAGPGEVVGAAERLLTMTDGPCERTHTALLGALLAAGEGDAARRRYPRPSGAELHDGTAWARHAIAEARGGDASAAQQALVMCAKLGVGDQGDPALFEALLEATRLSPEEWRERRAPWQPPAGDVAEAWCADRGLRPHPCQPPSPHWFGGEAVRMPPCPGCGHTLHAFFVFDVEAEPALRARLPGWSFVPLIGCVDCSLWMVRRDFRVDQAARAVEVLGVSASAPTLASLGDASDQPLEALPRRAVELRPIPDEVEPGSDRPQVAGAPDWVQDWEAAFCPRCHEPMVFVAAMGSTWDMGFEPEITINNGSGYQYHFACAPCGVLAVFGQNT